MPINTLAGGVVFLRLGVESNSSAPVHDLTHIAVALKTGKIIENTHGQSTI
jgi:hypothetical protein